MIAGADNTNEQGEAQMMRLKMLGLALLALFAFAAFTASAAMALEEGFLEHEAFTVATENASKPALIANKEEIACNTVSIEKVAVANDHHGSGVLHFTGCKAEKLIPVNTLGDAKEEILTQVEYLVCLVTSSTLLFGIWIQPTAMVHIEVPSVKQLLLVKGAAIGHILSGNGPATLFLVDFKEEIPCFDENGGEKPWTFEAAKDSEPKDFLALELAQVDIKFTNKVSLTD